MEKELIDELDIKDSLKEKLNYLKGKIEEVISNDNIVTFDIIIDEMCQRDIDILLEHTTKMLMEYELYDEIVKFRDNTRVEEYENSIIVIDKFNIFEDEYLDGFFNERRIAKFFRGVRNNNNIVIFTCTSRLSYYFRRVSSVIFDPDLCLHLKGNTNIITMYNELNNKYNEKNIKSKLTLNTFRKINNVLDNRIKDNNIIDYLYEYSLKKMIINNYNVIDNSVFSEFTKREKKINKKDDNKINEMIGLDNIKKELDELYNYLLFCKKNRIKDINYLNLFFLGNPGTGKTTVARMYAHKLYKMGYIKEDRIKEIVPNDLVGEYVGQTRDTARKILDNAKGGILFIDEAYLLYTNAYNKGKNPYMEEAIVELIKYLEDPKNVVIFAGYPDEMKKIYEANPGIKSRIYKEIVFNDYDNQELYQILSDSLIKKGIKIDKRSKRKIIDYIDNMKNDKNFGNARSMLTLGQKMIMKHAARKDNKLSIDYYDLPEMEIKSRGMGLGIYD